MPISRKEASEVIDSFRQEYKGLSYLKFVLLENEDDFSNTYGKHAQEAMQAWQGKLGAFSRSTNTVAVALASHDDKQELASTLAHEGIGHSGINTFDQAGKEKLLDAIIEARNHPGTIRDDYWQRVEQHYPGLKRGEQAEEVFCLMVEAAAKRKEYNSEAFQYAWANSVERNAEPLKGWGLAQIAEYVAHGLRENTRRQQIFPKSDQDQYRLRPDRDFSPDMQRKLDAISGQVDRQGFTQREQNHIMERCRENAARHQDSLREQAVAQPRTVDRER